MRGTIVKRLRKFANKLYSEAKPELRERQSPFNFFRNVKALYKKEVNFKKFVKKVTSGSLGASVDINSRMEKKSQATIVDPTESLRPNGDGAPALYSNLGNAEALAS
jgi:hypothetical protein